MRNISDYFTTLVEDVEWTQEMKNYLLYDLCCFHMTNEQKTWTREVNDSFLFRSLHTYVAHVMTK